MPVLSDDLSADTQRLPSGARVLHDLPWQGRSVTICIAVRRFRCVNRYCARQTFAKSLTKVARRFGRN